MIAGWRIADPKPGPEPAPELARQERLDREHAGLDTGQVAQAGGRHEPGMTAEQILAQCLDRDGQQLSATDTRAAEWSDADRLDVLGVQWQHVTRDAAQHRYEAAVRAALTDEEARQVLADPAATWLWRTLREAEAAGLDGAGLLRRAAASGPLTDAESVAKVLDWRIRQHTDGHARPGRPPLVQPGPADRRPGHRPVRHRTRRGDGRPAAAPRRARRRAPARLGARARAGTRAPAGPGGVGAPGRAGRRLPGDVGLHPPHRADRPPARAALPRSPGVLAGRRRGPGPPARRPDGAQRRAAVGVAVRVRPGNGMGAPVQGRRAGHGPRGDPPRPDRRRPGPPRRPGRRHRRGAAAAGRAGRECTRGGSR